MAVIFAVVGGGAVVGIATVDSYVDSYSDHSYYSDYDNYGDYSDAAERRQRRIEAKQKEINDQKYEVNTYKTQSVNPHLESDSLKREEGVSVSVSAVKEDGNKKIQKEETADVKQESGPIQDEINEIDKVISRIDQILSEDN